MCDQQVCLGVEMYHKAAMRNPQVFLGVYMY